MTSVPRRTTAPPAFCPTCGLEGEGVERTSSTIHTANYLCPAGHIWQTHWADLEVPA